MLRSLLAAGLICLAPAALAQTDSPIGFGEPRSGFIACRGNNTFVFEANQGDRIAVHLAEINDTGGVCGGRACCCFDQMVRILDSDSTIIAEKFYTHGNNCSARARVVLWEVEMPTAGQYTLFVSDGDNFGNGFYNVFVQRTNAPDSITEVMQSGDSFLKDLPSGQVHTYTFNVKPGRNRTAGVLTALIRMVPDGSSTVVPWLDLYDPTGRLVESPQSGFVEHVLKKEGTYTLLAYSQLNETGQYRIFLDTTTVAARELTWSMIKRLYRHSASSEGN